jgi:S1-C subfamily serine protease
MRVRLNPARLCLVFLLPALCLVCVGDELAEKGREIFKQNQRAIVTVQLVLKSKFSMRGMGGQSNESKKDATGTVVDPSGLTILSLSGIEPGDMMQSFFGDTGDDDPKFKMETELGDVKILLEDGAELPAEVVLRDKDLDLAFIRPKTKPATPMPSLDLANSGQAQVLDQVITLNRLGQAANRTFSASVERISAVVRTPRLFYIPDSTMTTTGLGCPAFTLDGKVLGIFVMRTVKTKGGGGMFGMFNFQADNLTSRILPADQILKAARQAPEVKPESKEEKK